MATTDPLEDIGSLVEHTLSILNPREEDASYSKVSLDTPSKGSFTLEDMEQERSPPGNSSRPGGPLSPPQPLSPVGPKVDLLSDMQSIRLNADIDPLSSTVPEEADADAAGTSSVAAGHELSTLLEGPEIVPARKAIRTSLAGSEDPFQPSAISISVKIPERTEVSGALGIKTGHWDYIVKVDSTLPGLMAQGMEVKRRFSEFDSLYKMLHASCRGYFIPPLPPKSLIGIIENSSEDFLRLRRADLQAFLRAVVAHPVLQQTEVVKVFLLQQGDLRHNPAWLNLSAVPSSPKRAGPSAISNEGGSSPGGTLTRSVTLPASGTALANLGNWMSWMKQSTMAVFQPPKRELPEDEVPLRQAKEMLEDLGRLLQLATQSARTVCQDTDKLAVDFREFGVNMGMLCKYEETLQSMVGQYTPQGHSASNRAADFRNIARCQAKQHSIWKALSLKSAATLVKLHDYLILMPEAIRALEEREAAMEQVFTLEEELAQKKHQVDSLAKGASSATATAERRVSLLSQSIASLEDQVAAARENYELIKGRNQSELARLGLEREADFRRMMYAFTASQAQLVQSSADLWSSLARQYGDMSP